MATPIINPGKRAFVAGKTGSGKSTLAKWLLQKSPQHWVIINPKHTAAYKDLPDSVTIETLDMKRLEKELSRHRFVIVNPPSRSSDPDVLDAYIMALHESWSHVGLCIDELYAVHKSNFAGQGLLGWLTRGRELKQSFLGLSQRPAFLSQFIFSESDYVGGMWLQLDKDLKRMVDMTGRSEFAARIPPQHWLWLDTEKNNMNYYLPVPLDKG